MLQINNISKKYITGDLVQNALNDVSLNLRDNELVAILGPSGSGKTTLLNIIGGLDHYDSGDLIINGISTKRYTDRDWDSYRNHTIGFVFQSYNLIPHQTVLSNVELALTISGISKAERKKRAIEALEKVGLGNQLHKKPNQMSGGQMQRVAIARALINDPDILLADEPTGALDSETSIQVMELLKEVAKDRLVVMVTHNPELAEEYATRIVKVRDGKIIDDSNPYDVEASQIGQTRHENMGKSSMSLMTSLSLSFNNLKSKKARTLLTSFAGSIGIIGIALILSISNGINTYITDIQKSTMSSYPISIESQAVDLTSIMSSGHEAMHNQQDGKVDHKLDAVYSNNIDLEMASSMTTSITEN
ncbi:MAG: ABC transporter ATP-binding protein, partial [Romboutsia sp.]|nr:ABC transporter ATP-binding protein [Romboutsia sp.]